MALFSTWNDPDGNLKSAGPVVSHEEAVDDLVEEAVTCRSSSTCSA
jgi:hypothetical protein